LLNTIQEALRTVDENVFYGGVTGITASDKWDYIVFSRGALKRTARGNTAYTREINVVIVREEYVPEETIHQVIQAMEAIPNVRFNESGGDTEYDRKGNTKTVVEMAVLSFSWVYKKQVET